MFYAYYHISSFIKVVGVSIFYTSSTLGSRTHMRIDIFLLQLSNLLSITYSLLESSLHTFKKLQANIKMHINM